MVTARGCAVGPLGVRHRGLWTLPLLVAPPLGSRDVYSYACQGWTYAHGVDPYAVGVAAAGCPWLDSVAPIWRDTPAPYGPVFVLLAALAVSLGGGLTGTIVLLRVIAVAGLLLAALCLPGLAGQPGCRLAGPPGWRWPLRWSAYTWWPGRTTTR
ncbi:hypothetical protein GCM10027614_28370 [Micromonospora vulcania]